MSGVWARMDAAGVLPQELSSRGCVGWLELPAGLSIEVAVGLMRLEGGWQARPRIAAPAITPAAGAWTLRIDGVPDGAACNVFDLDYQVSLGDVPATTGAIAFGIADAGRYQLEVTAPEPWIGLTLNLVLA